MTNKPFGVEELNIVGSAGTSLIEAVADLHIRVGGGRTVGIGTSVFNIQDGTADANNDSVLNVGIVTANEYYGLFKGTIDPVTSTISIASSLTDVIGVNDNQIYPKIAAEDSILFWDSSAIKTTYLKIGDGVLIDDDTLKGDYTLPVTGTTGVSGVGEAIWTLTPSSGTGDPVKLKAGSNVSIDATNVSSGEFTMNVDAAGGLTLDATVTDVLDLSAGGVLSADDPGADRIIFWDDNPGGGGDGKLRHLAVDGTSITITDTTLSAVTQSGTTYSQEVAADPAAPATLTGVKWRLKNETAGTYDDILISKGSGIDFTSVTANGFTISADTDSNTTYTLPTFGTTNGASGLSLTDNDGGTDDVNITGTGGITVVGNAGNDTLTIDGSGASGKTYTFTSVADVTNVNLRLNDGSANQDVLLTARTGITLDSITAGGFTINANSNAGKSYTLPVSGTTGVSGVGQAILTLTDDITPTPTTDPVKINAGSNISIDVTQASAGEFTIAADQGAGLDLNVNIEDIFSMIAGTLTGADPGADRIVFWDSGSDDKLTWLEVSTGLKIDGTELKVDGAASFPSPGSDKNVIFNDGGDLAGASTLNYNKAGDGTLTKTGDRIRCLKSGGENYADITADGGVLIRRADSVSNPNDGPYIDFKVTDDDADARIQMERVVTNPGTDSFSSIKFFTGGNGFSGNLAERLRIGKAGEIGIAGANYGTAGNVLTSNGDGSSVSWADAPSATTVTIGDEGSTTWRDIVYTAGAGAGETLQCNDTAGAVNGLQVRGSDGALRVKGDITAYRGSDITLKDNISPIKNALAKVSSISGNTFTWNEKSTDDKQGNDDTGVIAQEITALGLPGVTTTRNDGTQAVMYEKLVPLLIEAIKELKEEVDELKSRS